MSLSQNQPSPDPASPWKVPEVDGGLQFTTQLLQGVLDLGVKSPNHSLKAQHLLSRGIEVLVSIQHFLQSGEKSLLETLETLNELQATENVLTESIAILDEDTQTADSHPCDRAVMSSWHLNRNTFTAKLEELADTGPKKDGDRWTIVMQDVVRADDLSFATRLSKNVEENCEDEAAKKAVKEIVASLEKTENATKDAEKTRTESILGIMCLADETTRPESTGIDRVVRVVTDMAKHLQEPKEGKWQSISDRLHVLPVCRKVEKPLLLHHGKYTIPNIIEDAHAEILSSGAKLGELISLGPESPQGEPGKVEKHVQQIVGAMTEATRNLKSLIEKEKSFNDVKGEKSENQILYATMRLLGDTAMAITPILDLGEELNEQVQKVTASASKFVNTLTTLHGSPDGAWGKKLVKSLEKTADVLRSFGAPYKSESGENATGKGGSHPASTTSGSAEGGTTAGGNTSTNAGTSGTGSAASDLLSAQGTGVAQVARDSSVAQGVPGVTTGGTTAGGNTSTNAGTSGTGRAASDLLSAQGTGVVQAAQDSSGTQGVTKGTDVKTGH